MRAYDAAILSAFPLHAVPPGGDCQAATESGTRYLAAANGLWREINLPWVRVVHMLAPSVLRLPYGDLASSVEVRCGPVPVELVREFNTWARDAAPTEIAAAIIWNEVSGDWRLAMRHARSAGTAHVQFDEVSLVDGEHLVIDVHSHGHHQAFFSAEDNADDYGAMKFSLVVGSFNNQQPTSQMRLCMAGICLPAHVAADGELRINSMEVQ